MSRVINFFLDALRGASVFNSEVQVAPACVLWPDHDRQWESVISLLQKELPELFVLGDYNPERKIGPSIWLRCIIADRIDQIVRPKDLRPIIYLPGISRQDLRAIESCPDHLKPLAELQYRGVIWSQANAKDWTVLAFLKSSQGGIGLDVSQDTESKNAMLMALPKLLYEDVDLLKGKRLDKDFFNKLLTGGDPVKDILQWIDQGDSFKVSRDENEWKAFVEVCKSEFGFNPQKEGILAAASRLAEHKGAWQAIWERYCEAPVRYPGIPGRIRQCQMKSDDLFSDHSTHGGWPQWNDSQEKKLNTALSALNNLTPHEARKKILDLEQKHGSRRELVWTELGESPLAEALEHLSIMAKITASPLSAGNIEDLASGFVSSGWIADESVVNSLSKIERIEDYDAVSAAVRSVYLPWIEESARHLQKIWNNYPSHPGTDLKDIGCIIFVDGLRFDCAKKLVKLFENSGLDVHEKMTWAALPSVTGTGKPAVAPIIFRTGISESTDISGFEPMNSYQFKKALEENGWQIIRSRDPLPSPVLSSSDYPEYSAINKIWCEFGDIDHEGHDRGWKLAKHLDVILNEIKEKIKSLISAGWKKIRIVTDHGWLLMPGGLPKTEMPGVITDTKWGRCAVLKQGASTDERLYEWFWNPLQHFVLADGISCFKNGEEYSHGGLSLQECLTLELTISCEQESHLVNSLEITDIVWKGLRCTIAVDGDYRGISIDIRIAPGDSSSTVVVSTKKFKDNGTSSVVVENEDFEGADAFIVLIDENGQIIFQSSVIIGGGKK